MKNYEGITLLVYGPWDLKTFRGVGVSGPRERLGFFHFFERSFPECDVIEGRGARKIPVWRRGVGENKDMKHVKLFLMKFSFQ